jgi:hypothetical protein
LLAGFQEIVVKPIEFKHLATLLCEAAGRQSHSLSSQDGGSPTTDGSAR